MRPPLAFFVAITAAALLLSLFPGIDLWFSGLFYSPEQGFFLGQSWPVQLIYRGVPYLTAATIAVILAGLALALLGRPGGLGVGPKPALFLLVSLAIGPGLLTNTILKDNWGRARPVQTQPFGGERQFTPALVPAHECQRNCSFVSGHAAIGFYFVSFAFLARTRRGRRNAQIAALAGGGLFGLARIAQGGHFLSDVVTSGLLVYATSWCLYQLMIVSTAPSAALARLRALHPRRRLALACALTALAIALSIAFLDRPIAIFFHGQGETLHAIFRFITSFGVSTLWLVGSALLWLGLALAGKLRHSERLQAYSRLPLFFFTALAVPGILVDILKAVFGRARPKLFFGADEYFFGWWGARSDYWSFPSGHTATAVSIALALSAIWPRWRALYLGFAILVAASRVILTAHYLSDVLMASFIAVIGVRYVHFVFRRSGIDLAAARAGILRPVAASPWRVRLGLDRLSWRRSASSGNP